MTERDIIIQLLINKYKNENVTIELVKKIEKEANTLEEEYRNSNIPTNLPENQYS